METVLRTLPSRRRQRLRTARLTRRIQCFDSRTVALLVSMVITLGHRHRLVAGEVVDLRIGDAEVEHSCDEAMVEIGGASSSEVAYQQTAGAIAGLYEFAPDAEGVDNGEEEAPAENGQPDLELVEA
jgi:hypothetical protein